MTLEESALFRNLPAEEVTHLRLLAEEVAFGPDACIFREGDPGDALYIVKSGAVHISVTAESGERLALVRLEPGEMFGEMAVLDDQPRSATATAEGLTVVYRIRRQELLERLGRSPALALAVMRAISLRLRDFNQRYTRTVLTTERMALIGRFARAIVHDLKQPLGAILMAIDYGCREPSDTASRKMCHELVTHQVERIQALANEILEFTRGGPSEIKLVETDYAAFVTGLVGELESEARLSEIALALECPAGPIPVALDRHRLARVFYNLFHNAAQAMPNGGQVTIRVAPATEAVVTEVEDTGPGVPVEILDRLFEPFATYGKSAGTGLGLSICRKIVQEHGGQISAHNRPAGGALFRFTLPRPAGA